MPNLFLSHLWDSFCGTVPHLTEYFGLWAYEEAKFRELTENLNFDWLRSHAENKVATAREREQEREGKVGVVSLTGSLMKFESSLGGTSTVEARRQIRAMANDQSVERIVLRIDSPGGTVSGTEALGSDIRKANQMKPVDAIIEDMGASAAYWLASQARSISATPGSLVGSLGVIGTIRDTSEAANKLGVKVHVIRTGKFKGGAVDGEKVDAHFLAEMQKLAEHANGLFMSAVAQGRKMEVGKAQALFDGRVFPAEEAVGLGLVDRVEDLDDFFLRVAGRELIVHAFIPGVL